MDLLEKLKTNPHNPRFIKKEALIRLKEKIRKFPEMLEKRPIVYDENFVILGGNMRLKALRELSKEGLIIKEAYFMSAEGWSEEQKRQFIITDNISDGEWDNDLLANEWSDLPLADWGMENLTWEQDREKKETLNESYSQSLGQVLYEPVDKNVKVSDLFIPEEKFNKDIEKISNEEIRRILKARVAYFGKFNFDKIADYYAYKATPEEKRLFEKLALVLLDKDALIANNFAKIIDTVAEDNGQTKD